MADQPAPTGSSRPSTGGPADLTSAATAKNYVSTPPPVVPSHVPTGTDMQRAGMSPGQRFRADVAGADELAKSYDRPPEAKESEAQKPADAQQPTGNEDLERRVAEFNKMEADRKVWDETYTSPAVYKDELPDSYKPVDGIDFKFNTDDPFLVQAKELAHKHRLTQAQYSDFIGLYAGKVTQDAVNLRTAYQAEVQKLGPSGPAEIDSIMGFLQANLGRDGANKVGQMLVTADIVREFSRLVTKFINGGVGQFNNVGREPQQRGLSDSEWANMSWHERREYQRSSHLGSQPNPTRR